jgi:integrase
VAGGQRRRVSAKTRTAALTKRRKALERVAQGLPAAETGQTFAAQAQRWEVEFSPSLPLSPGTRRAYLDVLRLYATPIIGHLRMGDITPSHVAKVMTVMGVKGLSASYRHQAHKAMSHVFSMARKDRLIGTNPCREVPVARGNAKARIVPDRDIVLEMIRGAGDERLRTYLVISAHTGMRISEVLNLRWSDIKPSVSSIVVRVGKGGKSRAVFMTPTLGAQLKTWKAEQARQRLAADWWSAEDFIITTDIGTQFDTHNWRAKHFNPLRDKVAPGVTPHGLRHAFATIMLEEGVPMRVVAEQLGHSSTRITEQIYSHVTARLQAEAGAAVERALGKAQEAL